MSNPWLSIPLADYEGHMASVEVQQLDALSDLFDLSLNRCRPASVAILGIAGGNGLSRINPSLTQRILGIDINPSYLDQVRARFPHLSSIELHCCDLSAQPIVLPAVQLVHVALVFEHAGVDLCLQNAIGLVAPAGSLSVVLQLCSESAPGVGVSQFPSLQTLKPNFSLIDPAWLRVELAEQNFQLTYQTQRALPAGKSFWLGIFQNQNASL